MRSIDIICPLYNAEAFIENLNNSLLKQEKVKINKINYILTESKDKSESILNNLCIEYKKIKPSEFSHSLTRERFAMKSESDIIVFITQDIVIERDDWLYNLTKDIDDDIVAAYSRQLPKYENLEKYTREKNYPKESRTVSREDINELGLRTFFFSDASSAINLGVFKELKGYDGKKLPISEDMYFAYKVIMNGYKIKYCSDSEVVHSHQFTLKEIYERYKLTGKFFKENSYLDTYGTNSSGADMAKYIFKRILQDKNYKLLFRFPLDMCSRYLGMKAGQR